MRWVYFLLTTVLLHAQKITGKILDGETGDPLPGAAIRIQGTAVGTLSDENGNFQILWKEKLPVTLIVRYIGYDSAKVIVSAYKPVIVRLGVAGILQQEVEITEVRISQRQQESPLTVESMDALSVRETPSPDFYEGLSNLKGVDITTASLGFKIINTRGFNSTRPVRTLQILDGMDNQAPGLNFSLGNFVGASELDVQSVELVVGANSALYGPNAFNGVILMHLKDPFIHPGSSYMVKIGNRNLLEVAARVAQVIGPKERWAIKLNASFLRARDWPANNDAPTTQSLVGSNNLGGYDAVNRYGDENPDPRANNFDNSPYSQYYYPGLGIFHRTGYWESELVDYSVKSIKLSGGLYHKIRPDLQAAYVAYFGTGTTVYQGDNRYAIKDILFFQHKAELQGKKFYLRAYHTLEDAGKSYDIVFTGLLLQNYVKPNVRWGLDYQSAFLPYAAILRRDPLFPRSFINNPLFQDSLRYLLDLYRDSLEQWHRRARAFADGPGFFCDTCRSRLEPGTPEFEEVFQRIISNPSFLKGGSRFVDNSALYHLQGERTFSLARAEIKIGGNYRYYRPRSYGTIFADTHGVRLSLFEYGFFLHTETRWLNEDKLKIHFALRMDASQNFIRIKNVLNKFSLTKLSQALKENYVYSPALMVIYTIRPQHNLRLTLNSALRYPTLQDQYLYYNVGRAILKGNPKGEGPLTPLEKLYDFVATNDFSVLDTIFVPGVRPERLRTIEIGYKGLFQNRLYLDAGYYFSWYRDFLGFRLVSTLPDLRTGNPIQIYRLSSNAQDVVTTQGFAIGVNYYFAKYYMLSANYSWNVLNLGGAWMDDVARWVNRRLRRNLLREVPPADDPIIPAFNTPRYKYNLSLSGRDIRTTLNLGNKTFSLNYWGFSLTWRWVEGFWFEGSPQFTGYVPTYYTLDAQLSWRQPEKGITYKLGSTNLLNRRYFQAYGAPYIGRIVYAGMWIDL
ncbi:MAG: carboxypeptidase-like regulatory domain-containing protein [Bacteroidia bacterium]